MCEKNIVDLICTLNQEIWERYESTQEWLESGEVKIFKWLESGEVTLFEYHSIGYTSCIEFLGIMIWNEENDERHYDEEIDDYEPLEPFLRRKAIEIIKKVSAIRIG